MLEMPLEAVRPPGPGVFENQSSQELMFSKSVTGVAHKNKHGCCFVAVQTVHSGCCLLSRDTSEVTVPPHILTCDVQMKLGALWDFLTNEMCVINNISYYHYATHLQFGGGSSVISASSFWILQIKHEWNYIRGGKKNISLKVIRKLIHFHHMYKTKPHKSQPSNSGSNLFTNKKL